MKCASCGAQNLGSYFSCGEAKQMCWTCLWKALHGGLGFHEVQATGRLTVGGNLTIGAGVKPEDTEHGLIDTVGDFLREFANKARAFTDAEVAAIHNSIQYDEQKRSELGEPTNDFREGLRKALDLIEFVRGKRPEVR